MRFGRLTLHLVVLVVILAAIAATGIFRYLEGPPRGVHQWRQTDCASIALNYYQDHLAFFQPQEHNLTGENGATVSEFPLLYFLDAQLYRFFGPDERIMRLANLLFMVLGLFYLFRIGMLWHSSLPLAMVPVLLLIGSPSFVYYGVHFLPNVPAISCCLIGWYYFFRWQQDKQNKLLYLWLFLFLLGALLKMSEGMSLLAAGLILLWQHRSAQWWNRPWFRWGLAAFAVIGSWIIYATWYNTSHHNELSLIGALPFWLYDNDYYRLVAGRFYRQWSLQLFHPSVWWLLPATLVFVLIRIKSLPSTLQQLIFWTGIGSLVYILLWTEPLYHHDYYMLTPFVFFIFLLIGAALLIRESLKQKSLYVAWPLLVGASLIILFYQPDMQQDRNRGDQYENVGEGFYSIGPWLQSKGVRTKDKIISVGDPTRNVSLYLMNNRGWTDVYNKRKITWQQKVDEGASYVVVSGTPTKQSADTPIQELIKIGEYKGIELYQIPK